MINKLKYFACFQNRKPFSAFIKNIIYMVKKEMLDRFEIAYKKDGFPPMAGRIMGLFYISDQKYFTFEEIILEVRASKGAVSKTIKLLLELKRINYILSENQSRKRLFYLDIQGLIQFLRMVIDNYKSQNQLLKESLQIRTNENKEMNVFIKGSIQFNNDVLAFLEAKSEKYFNG